MKNKKEKIKFVKEQLSQQKRWGHVLFSEDDEGGRKAFTINWSQDNFSHPLDGYGKDGDKFSLYIGGSETIHTADKLGRVRSKAEPYDLKITKENAENLICILEAFLEAQS